MLHRPVEPTGAKFREANLRKAIFTKAHLEEADLSNAYLKEANLTNAKLTGANLRGAYKKRPDDGPRQMITIEELKQQTSYLEGATMPDGKIYPGQYTAREFEITVSFQVGEGWKLAAPETPDMLFIETPGPEGGQLLFTNPLHVFNSSNPSESIEVRAPENADEWVSWFQSHPTLNTSKKVSVSVGSKSGKQIDVTPSSTPENYPRDVCGEAPCIPLYPSGKSAVLSYDGWKYQFIILDGREATVIIDVGAPADMFDEFLPKAQKVLDSVEWKDG